MLIFNFFSDKVSGKTLLENLLIMFADANAEKYFNARSPVLLYQMQATLAELLPGIKTMHDIFSLDPHIRMLPRELQNQFDMVNYKFKINSWNGAIISCQLCFVCGQVQSLLTRYSREMNAVVSFGQRCESVASTGPSSSPVRDDFVTAMKQSLVKCAFASCVNEMNLQKCAGCRRVSYCSRKCQLADWSNHKAACKQSK